MNPYASPREFYRGSRAWAASKTARVALPTCEIRRPLRRRLRPDILQSVSSCWEAMEWTLSIGYQAPRTLPAEWSRSKAIWLLLCVRWNREPFARVTYAQNAESPTGQEEGRVSIIRIAPLGFPTVYCTHYARPFRVEFSLYFVAWKRRGFCFAFFLTPLALDTWRRISPNWP